MKAPIDQLEEELWDYCVIQHAAKDQEMAERWQKNEVVHLKERFVVRAIPSKLQPVVEEAILQWEKIERRIFSSLQMDKEQFLKDFEKAREDFLNGNEEWENFVVSVGSTVHGAVRNMNWVNLFSWVLPKADPENFDKHRIIGRMVTSIFYTELLSKYGKNPDSVINNPLGKIEARWSIVTQTKPIEERILLSINQIVKQFQENENPYTYLYESDIQCALFAELRKNIPEKIKVLGTKHIYYDLNLIYSEYGYAQQGLSIKEKIDIVCLDEWKIPSFNKSPYKGNDTYIYHLPVFVGIELKYNYMGYSLGISASRKDYEKLSKVENIQNKLSFFFIQDHEKLKPMLEKETIKNKVNKVDSLDGIYVISPKEIYKVVK